MTLNLYNYLKLKYFISKMASVKFDCPYLHLYRHIHSERLLKPPLRLHSVISAPAC